MIFENMAFPTPGFSEAPIIAIDVGERKIFFKFTHSIKNLIIDGNKNINKKFSFYIYKSLSKSL